MLSLVVEELGKLLDDPRVEKDICDVISGLLISVEHVTQEVDARFANCGPDLARKVEILSQDAFFDFTDGRACKRHFATYKVI